jgi:iron complex outermembrane receptor protein
MNSELKRAGHPMLAAVLTVSLTAMSQAEPSSPPPGAEPVGMREELELLKEEETVSIASRYEQPISQAPSNVYVITDEDIRMSGATDIPTILRRIPGLDVMQTTGGDFTVSIRGNNQLDANKILILIDGRSVYIDAGGSVLWKLLPITLPEIKRIEVLKGPASSIYGFNAFDGIVNIITKSPTELKGTTLQFGGGEFGTISSAAVHAGTVGHVGYRLSLGRDQNQQWRNRDALAFRSEKINVLTEYALSADSKISVSGGVVDANRFDGPLHSLSLTSLTPSQSYVQTAYERPNFFIRAWWSGFNTTNGPEQSVLGNLASFGLDRSLNPQGRFRGNTYNIESQHSLQIGDTNRLTYGINYRHNTLSYNIIDRFSREDRLGLYLQDEWKVGPVVTVIAGARYDLDTFINPTVSPRFALLYQPLPDHVFRFSISAAYRPPTLLEEHLDTRTVFNIPPSPSVFAGGGSRNLSPESIVSYEGGNQGWFLKHRLRLRTDVFFNHISDLIRTPGLVRANSGDAVDIYGGEAGIEILATRWLSGFANYSFQELAQPANLSTERAGPRFKWNVGLRGEWDTGINAEILYHHYGAATYPISSTIFAFAPLGVIPPDPRVGSYNLLNMRAGYRFWQQKAAAGYMRDAEVAVSVFNALNDEHKEHPLGDLIGRRVMGWLTLRF